MKYIEAMVDAQKYANMVGREVYVLRRKGDFKASGREQKGWATEETVSPQKPHSVFTEENRRNR